MKGYSMPRTAIASFASIALLCLAPAEAGAVDWIIKSNETHGRFNLTPTASVTPYYFSPGLRFGIPVAKSGFIPTLNDEVKIEIGVNFQIWWRPAWDHRWCEACDPDSPHYDPDDCRHCRGEWVGDPFFRLAFPVMMRWEFFLTKVWSLYLGLGFEFGIPFDHHYRDGFGPDDWAWVVFVFGSRFTVKDWFAFRIETGSLGMFVFGFEFMLGH